MVKFDTCPLKACHQPLDCFQIFPGTFYVWKIKYVITIRALPQNMLAKIDHYSDFIKSFLKELDKLVKFNFTINSSFYYPVNILSVCLSEMII